MIVALVEKVEQDDCCTSTDHELLGVYTDRDVALDRLAQAFGVAPRVLHEWTEGGHTSVSIAGVHVILKEATDGETYIPDDFMVRVMDATGNVPLRRMFRRVDISVDDDTDITDIDFLSNVPTSAIPALLAAMAHANAF